MKIWTRNTMSKNYPYTINPRTLVCTTKTNESKTAEYFCFLSKYSFIFFSPFSHAIFKKTLVDLFRRKADEKEARERYLTDTYAKLSISWSKKVERVENSRKRKERDAKARELYEKIFPELRKQREDKERDHRLGTRGAVRSEADIEDVIERLQEQEVIKNIFRIQNFLKKYYVLSLL